MRTHLRIAEPCDEDFDSMRLTDHAGVRLCDACRKRVHTVDNDEDAVRVLREASARKERSVCMRIAVATVALAACAPATHTVTLGPLSPEPLAGGGGGICDIDPTACSSAALRRLQQTEYSMGAIQTQTTVLGVLIDKVRDVFRRRR